MRIHDPVSHVHGPPLLLHTGLPLWSMSGAMIFRVPMALSARGQGFTLRHFIFAVTPWRRWATATSGHSIVAVMSWRHNWEGPASPCRVSSTHCTHVSTPFGWIFWKSPHWTTIQPRNIFERITCTVIVLVAGLCWAYILGEVGAIVTDMNAEKQSSGTRGLKSGLGAGRQRFVRGCGGYIKGIDECRELTRIYELHSCGVIRSISYLFNVRFQNKWHLTTAQSTGLSGE